ncbi:MAG: DUF2905 domain-containing protein [Bacteriovoracia bacterium]
MPSPLGVLPKVLIFSGLALVIAGLLLHFGGKWLPWGRLPGDVAYERGGVRVYFPWVTCLILSALLTLGGYLYRYFSK